MDNDNIMAKKGDEEIIVAYGNEALMQLTEDEFRSNLLEIETGEQPDSPKTIQRMDTCTLTEDRSLPSMNGMQEPESPNIYIQQDDISMATRGPTYQTTITTTSQFCGQQDMTRHDMEQGLASSDTEDPSQHLQDEGNDHELKQNPSSSIYAKPIQLIQLIANKVEPQSKFLNNQQAVMSQHQSFANSPASDLNHHSQAVQLGTGQAAQFANGLRNPVAAGPAQPQGPTGTNGRDGSAFQLRPSPTSPNASTLHIKSNQSSTVNAAKAPHAGLFISGNGPRMYQNPNGEKGTFEQVFDDGTMRLINRDLIDDASHKDYLQPKLDTQMIRKKKNPAPVIVPSKFRRAPKETSPQEKQQTQTSSNVGLQVQKTCKPKNQVTKSSKGSPSPTNSPHLQINKGALSQRSIQKDQEAAQKRNPNRSTLQNGDSQSSNAIGALKFTNQIRHQNQQSHMAFTTRETGLQLKTLGQRTNKNFKNMSRQASGDDINPGLRQVNTYKVTKHDIVMANQISNDSLLSKTDTQIASKTALRPKFNATTSPFMPIDQMKSTHKNFLKGEMNKQRQAYRAHRRRRRTKDKNTQGGATSKEMLDAKIIQTQNSMGSKEATMTLEAVESHLGGETGSKLKLSLQGSTQLPIGNQTSFQKTGKRETESKRSNSPLGALEKGNPLKAIINDRAALEVTLMHPMPLNEVMTASSYLKIKPPEQVHKNVMLKKGPVLISQQSMQLFGDAARKRQADKSASSILPFQINKDIHSVSPPLIEFERKMAAIAASNAANAAGEVQVERTQNESQMSTDTKELVDQSTIEDALKRQPFDLKSHMISEITELMSKDSMSCHRAHLTASQEDSLDEDKHIHKSRFEENQRGEVTIMVMDAEKRLESQPQNIQPPAVYNKKKQLKKPYIGPVSLRPDSKLIEKPKPQPITVNAASQADRDFKFLVQDCVRSLRVHKDQKQTMIKLLNEDFKAKFMKRELSRALSPDGRNSRAAAMAMVSAKKKMNQTARIFVDEPDHPSHMKGITNESAAIELTQQRNTFAKERNSLPVKHVTQKPLFSQQASPAVRYAPNSIKMQKFGGRFFTDTRRAFSLGVPVPPGPLPQQPIALCLGRQVPLNQFENTKEQRMTYLRNNKPKEGSGRKPTFNQGMGDSPNKSKKMLPQILSPHHHMMLRDFPDAGDTTDSVDRGFSAFTKSQIMDNDTQTNFNIVDYDKHMLKQAEDELVFDKTIKQSLANQLKMVTFDEPRYLKNRTNSQLLREQQESQEWYTLAQEIVKRSESEDGEHENVRISLPQLLDDSTGLINFEIDDHKIAEIKDALDEYQRLKQQEGRNFTQLLTDEENRIKEYDRARRRRSTIPATPTPLYLTGNTRRQPIVLRDTHNSFKQATGQLQTLNSLQNKELDKINMSINSAESNHRANHQTANKPKQALQIFKRYADKSRTVNEPGMTLQNFKNQPTTQANTYVSRNIINKTLNSGPTNLTDVSGGSNDLGSPPYLPEVEHLLPVSVASQGARHRNTTRAAYDTNPKRPMNLKVDQNRVKMERFEKSLEKQFEKQNKSLERGMYSNVQGSVNKHKGGKRNGKGKGSGDAKFNQKQLVEHRQGHMLENLKKIQNLANPDSHQIKVLRNFITSEINKVVKKSRLERQGDDEQRIDSQASSNKAYLPSIGNQQQQNWDTVEGVENAQKLLEESLYSMQYHLNQDSGLNPQHQNSFKQLDDEIQQFERRNKLLAGNYKQKPSNMSPQRMEDQCQKVGDRKLTTHLVINRVSSDERLVATPTTHNRTVNVPGQHTNSNPQMSDSGSRNTIHGLQQQVSVVAPGRQQNSTKGVYSKLASQPINTAKIEELQTQS